MPAGVGEAAAAETAAEEEVVALSTCRLVFDESSTFPCSSCSASSLEEAAELDAALEHEDDIFSR